jgi:hypothetical protein
MEIYGNLSLINENYLPTLKTEHLVLIFTSIKAHVKFLLTDYV